MVPFAAASREERGSQFGICRSEESGIEAHLLSLFQKLYVSPYTQ
jgi:hypothetical protein